MREIGAMFDIVVVLEKTDFQLFHEVVIKIQYENSSKILILILHY